MLRLLAPSFIVFAWSAAASVNLLPAAPDVPILTISGEIGCTNDEDVASFDLDALEALGTDTVRTTTIWTDGAQEFEGVPLHALLQAVCATGDTVQAWALNDYHIDFPLDPKTLEGALVAYRRNGAEMPLRDKGPLWIVFPWDADEAYQTEEFYNRSIWQLDRIEVID
ncbi:oxidoreductase [Palleronia sp.]|uniref:oxidoreductase n=1 Tax=Palleronia sp. TaxID=1940284 RepID=UPI0035C7BBF0